MRAPPESLIWMKGAPFFKARDCTSAIRSACISPREPPSTVKSWENRNTCRPPTLPVPVTTPSPGNLFWSSPKSVALPAMYGCCSMNEPGSTSSSMRARAVSLPLAPWALAFSGPPAISALRSRYRFSAS